VPHPPTFEESCFLARERRSGIVVVMMISLEAATRIGDRNRGSEKHVLAVRSAHGGNMKKLIATIAAGALLCVSGAARAERSYGSRHGRGHAILVGMDTEFGIPLGNYADVNSVGVGATVTGEYALMEMLGATARIGFQGHVDRTVNGLGSHVHAIPFLLGTKYYIGGERQGLFGAFELGIFDLMSSFERRAGGNVTSTSSNDVKFGMGVGAGFQQDRWNVRVNVHTQDVGNFGSAFTITGGLGYQFASF
jgi:hypothetical protein